MTYEFLSNYIYNTSSQIFTFKAGLTVMIFEVTHVLSLGHMRGWGEYKCPFIIGIIVSPLCPSIDNLIYLRYCNILVEKKSRNWGWGRGKEWGEDK